MTEGVVNLPRIMQDVLLKRPTGNSRAGFSRDEIYHVREQDMYCLYGDWKGEQPIVRRVRLIPPPQAPPVQQVVQQEEQHPPPPPVASEIPSSSIDRPPEPSLREILRHLERQD
ncbi:hypothetical protein PIB30_096586 [Stylosanthes scabra]|uniref:Uncharacterized protein n=1 Tax=Stylosanthes scabra TaxID=79078 RepID=A0ABU6QVE1_9FABA|nr:hypothetical protein [Stylosanthes scabra]